ncbi:NAD-dependent epimerase/dehydratase family protein [Aliarcobacter cryaerophilus]|uniref:NAD-dependent epimerase/dehydratase family protein n=1 Tax=Aliarcobacter cryaerophilus TaxID=28198 RepID=UPI0021B6685B|nr:NAD-dependent epimerase/dehydratase family protein [Aliarcobacter cryaerophilus]MCT7528313.1 NAD-dependent epimerase/dehydratase family protein [Aliarcobacter cryaerophilus]
MKKKVLITGGLGFIGTNLIRNMRNQYEVYTLDNLSSLDKSKEKCLDMENLTIGDIQDFQICLNATKNMDIVVHLAAKGNVVDSVQDPLDNFNNNVIGTFNVIKAACENGVKKIVFASTGGALMGNCELPVSEKSIPKPIAPYGASKLAGEGYCHAFANVFDTPITILRFANVYGPFSSHKKGLINTFMKKIDKNENIEIFGDGTATRDFLYVDDLCDGIICGINYNHKKSEIFHLATGKEITIIEVAQILLKVSKGTSKILFKDKRKGEVERNFASYVKANEILNFKSQVSLEVGLKRCWEWFIENK